MVLVRIVEDDGAVSNSTRSEWQSTARQSVRKAAGQSGTWAARVHAIASGMHQPRKSSAHDIRLDGAGMGLAKGFCVSRSRGATFHVCCNVRARG